VFNFQATDPDEDDTITYDIVPGSVTTSANSFDIFDDKDNMFAQEKTTGYLRLNIPVRNTMTGFFEFRVEATDEGKLV
jgi:hypothetical protein